MVFGKNELTGDAASRIREQARQMLLEREQIKAKAADERVASMNELLATQAKLAQAEMAAADAQLREALVVVDTLIEFIVLNHGEVPNKLAEIIADRTEQRMAKAAERPKSNPLDSITGGVDGQILRKNGDRVEWVEPEAKL